MTLAVASSAGGRDLEAGHGGTQAEVVGLEGVVIPGNFYRILGSGAWRFLGQHSFKYWGRLPHMSKASVQNTSRLLCKLPNNCGRNHPRRGWAYLTGFPAVQPVKHPPAMRETRVQPLGWEVLEMGKAVHPSILAWRIPWRTEPGRLQSMGLQRVGCD